MLTRPCKLGCGGALGAGKRAGERPVELGLGRKPPGKPSPSFFFSFFFSINLFQIKFGVQINSN